MKDFSNVRPLVLVVDDDRNVLEEVAAILSGASIACRTTTNCEEAMEIAQASRPDLVLCDFKLQGETGPDLYQWIKRQPGLADVPVMFLSGAQLPDIIRRSYDAGGIYCIRKPFDADVLLKLIDRALGVPQA